MDDEIVDGLVEQIAELQTELATIKTEVSDQRWQHLYGQLLTINANFQNIHARLEDLENAEPRRPVPADARVRAEKPIVEP